MMPKGGFGKGMVCSWCSQRLLALLLLIVIIVIIVTLHHPYHSAAAIIVTDGVPCCVTRPLQYNSHDDTAAIIVLTGRKCGAYFT